MPTAPRLRQVRLILVMGLATAMTISTLSAQESEIKTAEAASDRQKWFGTIDAGPIKLRVVFDVGQAADGTLSGTLTSLDQGDAELKIDSVKLDGNQVTVEVNSIKGRFEGTLNEAHDQATGTWTQLGNELPLTLKRVDKVPERNLKSAWSGTLEEGPQKLLLQFRIVEEGDGEETVLFDSLTQGVKGLSAKMKVEDRELSFRVPAVQGKFEGTLDESGEKVTGTWTQLGNALPLELTKSSEPVKAPKQKRPQHPEPPFSYDTEDVKFYNDKDDVTLAGTLTLPQSEGPFPAIVLVSGSGPQDRNEEVMGHKPFLVIADHLTQNGIAVLRFDDRGVGDSTGDFAGATTADFANDVRAAIDFLKQDDRIQTERIGIVGHSEGGGS